jgi:hypothetical protein
MVALQMVGTAHSPRARLCFFMTARPTGGMGVYAAWPPSLSCVHSKVSKFEDWIKGNRQRSSLMSFMNASLPRHL